MLTTHTPVVSDVAHTPVTDMSGTWWVVQTRPQYERRLAHDLSAIGVDVFLPSERIRIKRKDRPGEVRELDRLLYPAYLFINGDAEARYEASRSRHSARIITVNNQARLSRELASVERAVEAGVQMQTYREFKVGMPCRVRAGPLMGLEGTLVRRDDDRRVFVLEIHLLGQSTLDIDPELLEPA